MYYYLVKNDIIKEYKDDNNNIIGRTTDEPQFVKNLDDMEVNALAEYLQAQ